MIRDYVRLIRIKHWIKDVFIFAPLIFSFNFYKPSYIGRTLIMCAAFCLAASAVYVFNDVTDRQRDRLHPKKKDRPVASGAVSVRSALILAALLLVAAVAVSGILGLSSVLIVLAYIGLNAAYSLLLKNQTFIDVMVIATGFLIRVVAGAIAIDVELSSWMLLTTFFLSLFLGFGKRRKELAEASTGHRAVFQDYSIELLNSLIIISAALTIITYSLYVVTSKTMIALGRDKFIATIPFVVFGVFRYMFLIYKQNNGGDPAEVLLRDRAMLIDIALWVCLVFALLGYTLFSGGGS
jgi:decaprenyl-phosphate phosphoribosyltransferase